MRKLIGLIFFLLAVGLHGQNLSIAVEDTACVNANPAIVNLSSGIDSIQYDFCPGELVNSPEATIQYNIPANNIGLDDIQTLYDGSNYYAFVLSNTNNELYRVTIGDSLTDTPSTFDDFGNVGSLSNARRISGIQEGNTWYVFISNFGNNSITRVDFGTDLSGNIQVANNLGNINSALSGPFALEALEIGGNYYLIVGNHLSKQIRVFDYGNSFNNTPTTINDFTVPSDIGNLSALKTVLINDNIYLAVCGQIKAFLYDFEGADLSNTTTLLYDLSTFGIMSAPRGLDVLHDNGNVFINVMGFSGNYYSYQFDNSFNFVKFNNYGVFTGLTDTRSLDFNFQNSEWIGYSINRSTDHELFQISYPDDCSSTVPSSYESMPTTAAYDALGWQYLTVDGFSNGFRYHHSDSVFISGMTDVDFSSVVSCVGITDFTSILTSMGDVAFNYSWDFDDPGSGASNNSSEANPTHTYDTPGDYNVFLSVTDECGINLDTTIVVTVFDQNDLNPGFEAATALLCSNSLIQFNDTSTFTTDIPQAWAWYIDDVLVSTDQNPELIFSSSGTFSVELEVTGLSTCVKTAEQMIDIEEGPSVEVTFNNNCFGEEVQFQTIVTGDDSGGYSWDLNGDNIEDSTSPNPTFTYPSATTYIVTLQVSNAIGCITEVSFDLEVPDDDFLDFTIGEAVENLPVNLNGLDNTISNDSIVSWDWLIDGNISSSVQDTLVVFSSPGTYEAQLTATTAQGCVEIETKDIIVEISISPTSIFDIEEAGCLNQTISINNSTVNATSYVWDFCLEDFTETPNLNSTDLVGVGTLYGYKLLEENGNWFGFLTERDAGVIYRLDFGDSPKNAPSITSLGNPFGLLQTPTGIDFVNENGIWYCFVGFFNNDLSIVRLDFGDGLENDPTNGSAIGNFDVAGRIRDIDVVADDSSYYLLIPSYTFNNITVVDFGNSVLNSVLEEDVITTTAISGAANLNGITSVEVGENWYVLVSSLSNSNIHQLNFGTSLFNSTPTQEATYSFASVDRPFRSDIIKNGDNYLALIGNDGLPFSIINFNDFTEPPIEMENSGLPSVYGIEAINYNGEYIIQGGFSANHQTAIFSKKCTTNQASTDFSPSVTYSNSGEFIVELISTNDLGNSSVLRDTIIISMVEAPSINFAINQSRCISNPNTFIPSTIGLTSYSWDFNNDGIEDSNEESPQVLFDTLGGVGTYTVRLDVSDGTCNNFYEEEITIYNPPPAPSYDFSASRYCVDAGIDFSNTTDDASYTGPLSYSWEFIDDATSSVVGTSDEENPTFSFSTSGTKTVRLTSSIPGCEETTQQTITINPPPTADFTAGSVCQNESMQFTNSSVNADTYLWDFGDGFNSTAAEPSHIFTDAGNYNVSLTATDTNGCDHVINQEVSISATPQSEFDFEIPCTSSEGIQFFDMSTVENADIVSWRWDVDGVEVSTAQNPTISFDTEGILTIALTTISSNGCESYHAEDIEILAAPQPDFEVQIACQGEASVFTDNTSFSGNIISWVWTIDGVAYNTENANHIFQDAGIYDVSLEVTGQNFCSESITKSVEVLQLPSPAFTVVGSCDNELITITDLSEEFNDAIISRTWLIDDEQVGNGTELFLNNLSDGSYTVTLELETAFGCVTNSSETLEINDSPESSFSSSKTYGLPNDQINFTNSSAGAASFEWLLNGAPFSTEADAETLIFSEVGTHVVSLVAQNSFGCADTSSQQILIAIPEIDLAIGSLELVAENNTGRIFLEVQNFSNLPIEITNAEIILEDQFTLTEQIEQFINVGQTSLVNLNVGVPLGNSDPSYLCVRLSSQYVDYPDLTPINNEKCINIQPTVKVENPFPNPVTDQFRIKVVSPEAGTATLKLLNSAGKVQIQNSYNTSSGLNNFFAEMSFLDSGIYFITIEINGTTFRRKVIKL
ncbi:PKD domain-containing protein [Ekhidna sp.]|uniref:PKD domain-containing protein n=1 Tax=Ekhidna sp. TaxID=2608089 RepID=UPI003B50A99B